jgi:hypothetical protein
VFISAYPAIGHQISFDGKIYDFETYCMTDSSNVANVVIYYVDELKTFRSRVSFPETYVDKNPTFVSKGYGCVLERPETLSKRARANRNKLLKLGLDKMSIPADQKHCFDKFQVQAFQLKKTGSNFTAGILAYHGEQTFEPGFRVGAMRLYTAAIFDQQWVKV